MKIKLHVSLASATAVSVPGDVIEVSAKEGAAFIAKGLAEEVEAPAKKATAKKAPETEKE